MGLKIVAITTVASFLLIFSGFHEGSSITTIFSTDEPLSKVGLNELST